MERDTRVVRLRFHTSLLGGPDVRADGQGRVLGNEAPPDAEACAACRAPERPVPMTSIRRPRSQPESPQREMEGNVSRHTTRIKLLQHQLKQICLPYFLSWPKSLSLSRPSALPHADQYLESDDNTHHCSRLLPTSFGLLCARDAHNHQPPVPVKPSMRQPQRHFRHRQHP